MPRPRTDLTGVKCGKLTVIRHLPERKRNSPVWLCFCDCGGEVEVLSYNLLSKKAKSCGCLHKSTGSDHFNWKGFGGISGNYWSSIKRHARDRNLEFLISKEEAMRIFEIQDRRCALSGQLLTLPNGADLSDRTASLDRVDSSRGYTVDNIQWVHKLINMAKRDMSDQDFIDLCKSIVEWSTK